HKIRGLIGLISASWRTGSSPATKSKVGINHSDLFYFHEVMFTVYVLYSRDYDKIYIGYSSDVKTRLKFHNELGRKGWTRKYRP
ncbi:MAG: GIY-YIG nuclease family protein, partial [Salinivirgaceae bacterium]